MAYLPLNTNNDMATSFNTVNNALRDLNNQQITKTYRQANGNAIVEGKLPYAGGYGSMYYDANGLPSIIIGILPDGTTGIAVAKAGQSVLSAFS